MQGTRIVGSAAAPPISSHMGVPVCALLLEQLHVGLPVLERSVPNLHRANQEYLSHTRNGVDSDTYDS